MLRNCCVLIRCGVLVAARPIAPLSVARVAAVDIHTTSLLAKVKKGQQGKKTANVLSHAKSASAENAFVQSALKEMNETELILRDELARHFSLQVDLRVYEDIVVKMDKGDEHKLSHLARVSLKSPQMVMINFSDNPGAIKFAKVALQKSLLSVTPQHEGVVLYVPTPRMTRERREQLANEAKGKMLNQYKAAINEIYTKMDKKSGRESKTTDAAATTRAELLQLKRAMETRGADLVEQKRKELLKEVA